MKFIPILSKELQEFEEKQVCLIGKIINVNYERKYTLVTMLDKYGYFNCILFDPINVQEFKTAIVLGRVRKFKNELFVYVKKLVYLDISEEYYWRKRFLIAIKRRLNKTSHDKVLKIDHKEESVEEKPKKEILTEINGDIDIKTSILHLLRELDRGNGVSIKELSEYLDISEDKIREIIERLRAEGEIYESSPDRYKVL